MRIGLVAVDLDGTVVRSDRTVSARTRDVLRRCSARHIAVVVVTARRWSAAEPLLQELGLRGYVAVDGGATVRELPGGRVVVRRTLPRAMAAAATRILQAHRLQPMVQLATGGDRIVSGDGRADGPAARRYLARARTQRSAGEALAPLAATRVLAFGAASRVRSAARACRALGAPLLVQRCIVPLDNSGERALELHVMAATKGDALRELCQLLGVSPGTALAVGDAPSDVSMLEAAGIPVVMGQAEAGVRGPGMVLAPTADADGAAWAVETFALSPAR